MATDTAELRYFTARETARILRLSDHRMLGLINSGGIRSFRIGRTIRVSAEAIREFELTGGRVPTNGQELSGQDLSGDTQTT